MNKLSSTADAILDAAQALIVKGGYNGFSYADIAEVVGIRKASIHHHFPNKSDLVVALVGRYIKELQAGLAALQDSMVDPAARLRAYITYWRTYITDGSNPHCMCVVLAGELPSLPEQVAEGVRTHFRLLGEWLETTLAEGKKMGKIRLQVPANIEAQSVMALVHGAMLSTRVSGDEGVFMMATDQIFARLGI